RAAPLARPAPVGPVASAPLVEPTTLPPSTPAAPPAAPEPAPRPPVSEPVPRLPSSPAASSSPPAKPARPASPVEQLNEAGQRLFGAERYEEALDCANKALALDPRDATSLSRRANCFFLLGRGEDAVEAHERLLELHPGRIGSWLDKAVTEKRLGRDPQASRSAIDLLEVAQADADLARSARTLKKELESKKARPAARSHLGWLALAHQAVGEGRLRDALELLDRAPPPAPRDPDLWRFKGD